MTLFYKALLTITVAIVIAYGMWASLETVVPVWLDEARQQPLLYSLFSFLFIASDTLLPVPSSVVMYLNGVVLGGISGFVVSLAGCLTSSSVGYLIGYALPHFSKALNTEKTRRWLLHYGPSLIVATRPIPAVGEAVALMAGIHRLSYVRYLLLSGIGAAPLCAIYAYLGSISSTRDGFYVAVAIAIVIGIALYLPQRKVLYNLQTLVD